MSDGKFLFWFVITMAVIMSFSNIVAKKTTINQETPTMEKANVK